MEKLLSKIHWLIILGAIYNIGMYYNEVDEELMRLEASQTSQKVVLLKAKKTKKEIEAFYKDIQEAKGRIERVASEIEKIQQLLPTEVSDTENIGLLRKIAEDINIKELSIMPDKEEAKGFYVARKYKFKAKATYLQFLIMFEKIAENKRILNISDLYFKKLEQPQRSKFQLIDGEFNLEAYRYNSAYKEDRGIEEIEKQFKGKATAAKKDSSKRKSKSKLIEKGEE